MNFFEAQERARRSSRMLVWWFALSVVGVILSLYAIVTLFYLLDTDNAEGGFHVSKVSELGWWNPQLLLMTSLVAGGVIAIGSLTKLSQLSAGGKVVAQNLGGRAVEPRTTDLRERRLLNVVEEMAIASGVPVPEVWIMDVEHGINAFAAGTDPTNAVIGVTRGTIDRLTRSELQGVVAHEFSHILNGDMKLNMRLMGWVFGLVMLSMLGRMIMESIRFMRGSRDSKNGGWILALLVIGFSVWLVGSIGVFFARVLQSSISRQREYLADASAVQFTRDTNGISGALKKIGGFSGHGKISSPKVAEARHMFFAGTSFSQIMATHPPLEKRIKALDSRWDGKMLQGKADPVDSSEFSGAMNFSGSAELVQPSEGFGTLGESSQLNSHVGAAIRGDLRRANVNSFSKDEAKTLLLGLLVAADGVESGAEILRIHKFDDAIITQVTDWSKELVDYTSAKKLALVDLSLSWLRRMSREEAREFVAVSYALIEADGQVDLFEFMLQQVIRRHVEIGLGLEMVPSIKYRKLADLEFEMANLLSVFTALSGSETALQAAAKEYREHTRQDLVVASAGLKDIAAALAKMDAATPLVKQQILRLCSLVVMDDQTVGDSEIELLRATAEAIGAPIPPIVSKDSRNGRE